MMSYETRLVAALRSLGAEEHVVTEATTNVRALGLHDAGVTRWLGEPEEYARTLVPDATPRARYAFVLTGVALAIVGWVALRAARDDGIEPFESMGPLAPLPALLLVLLGVLAEFGRYLRTGRR